MEQPAHAGFFCSPKVLTTDITDREQLMPLSACNFAWLEKNRCRQENCERLVNASLQFAHLAFPALFRSRS